MAEYLIREENMERLEKKLATIAKKCQKSNCTFSYNIIGEEFSTGIHEDGTEYIVKYIKIDIEGTAKYNGWEFVATLDHHEEGNVVRAYNTELAIPDKYKTCGPTCEHCNKIRSRKDTYLIYNAENNEFKQVGNSCLKEFTNGLSAEDVAFFVSIYNAAEEGYGYSGSSSNRYIDVEHILRYAFECYKHWGYQRTTQDDDNYNPNYRSTKERVTDYYYINRMTGKMKEQLQDEMDEVGFNPDSEENIATVSAALEWIRNIDKEEMIGNEYIRNLHVICSDQYTEYRSLGILVSLTTAYNRHLGKLAEYAEKQKAEEEKKAQEAVSEYIGEVGKRITINCKSFSCISSWENIYGVTFLYRFVDENDNICIWYASSPIQDPETVATIVGTVKDHSEYNGAKQTVLTRCKVTARNEKPEEEHPEGSGEVQKALDDFFDYVNA